MREVRQDRSQPIAAYRAENQRAKPIVSFSSEPCMGYQYVVHAFLVTLQVLDESTTVRKSEYGETVVGLREAKKSDNDDVLVER